MIDTYVNIHIHRRTGEGVEVVSVMAGRDTVPEAPFSIGIHPWQLVDGFDTAAALREVETAPATAIGEIGLDHAIQTDPAGQRTIFTAQLRIAQKRNLPVILHCVRAFEPTMELLAFHTLPAVIFHGFIGSPEQAARATEAGYRLSFGHRSLESPKTVEALRRIPLEKLFLETDDATAPISDIYARAAEILAVPMEELVRNIHDNYTRLFSKP